MSLFATHNSAPRRAKHWWLESLTPLTVVGFLVFRAIGLSAEGTAGRTTPLARAQASFVAAQQRWENEPTNHVAAWEFARAAFDRAEFATNDTERATIAVQGIGAARKLLARAPQSAPGHYYLGKNLGQLARTKLLGALKIVDEMEEEFKQAAALDELFDYAGPHRYLGELYEQAPVIGSVGSRSKARKHLERAAQLAPDYPENRLNLAEAYLKWREKKLLQRELDALARLWPEAKTKFTTPEWEAAWAKWSRRWQKLKADAAKLLNP
jgi:tetratricopeptide (TPR) repeat protein